jgi:SAM-dependent methyltransferase
MALTYDPSVFAVSDIDAAKQIILTHEDSSTAERWAKETPYLADLIEQQLEVNPGTLLLDYGSGIGRIAKALIERQDCRVIGVDISPHMRSLGLAYVRSDRYAVCSPDMLVALVGSGLRFDAAISVWVLQHCARPEADIGLLAAAMRPGAPAFIVNNVGRAVPTVEDGWIDDGIDVSALLAETFEVEARGRLDAAFTTREVARHTFWARVRLPGEVA